MRQLGPALCLTLQPLAKLNRTRRRRQGGGEETAGREGVVTLPRVTTTYAVASTADTRQAPPCAGDGGAGAGVPRLLAAACLQRPAPPNPLVATLRTFMVAC